MLAERGLFIKSLPFGRGSRVNFDLTMFKNNCEEFFDPQLVTIDPRPFTLDPRPSTKRQTHKVVQNAFCIRKMSSIPRNW